MVAPALTSTDCERRAHSQGNVESYVIAYLQDDPLLHVTLETACLNFNAVCSHREIRQDIIAGRT